MKIFRNRVFLFLFTKSSLKQNNPARTGSKWGSNKRMGIRSDGFAVWIRKNMPFLDLIGNIVFFLDSQDLLK